MLEEKLKAAKMFLYENCHDEDIDETTTNLRDKLFTENVIKYMQEYADYVIQQEIDGAKPKWISVKDRLPKRFERVLVVTNLSNRYLAEVDGSGDWDDYNVVFADKGENITHWMPLPESPKENT